MTPFAVFLVLAGLLLLVLSLPCPHGTETARSAEPITSAAGPLGDARADVSCSTISDHLAAAPRTAECPRPDDAGAAASFDASSVDERAACAALSCIAVVALETDRPHGWALLVLLGIERK